MATRIEWAGNLMVEHPVDDPTGLHDHREGMTCHTCSTYNRD